ncbi:MAG TPA: hypothetical protein VHW92_09560 [Mycobacteriales bacterium]|nr:hypothetical protein [Mycobacteriales bacterium]
MQILLIAIAGLAVGLTAGLVIGARAGYLALRIAARVIATAPRETTHQDVQLAA